MATPRYGMTKPRHLFSGRQLATLTVLCDLIAEARTRVLHDSGDESYANAIATYLAFTMSKTTTRNCTLAIWERGMDQRAGALGRQAIQMQWDYAETNPFAGAGGDFSGTVESLSKVLEKLVPAKEGRVRQQDARKLVGSPKIVFSTDPPYYDNVPYADLSDFFYVWLRRGLGDIYPDLFATLLAPKASELVADQLRHGGRDSAQAFFEKGLQEVFGRIRENSSPDYPFTVYYAFKQQETELESDDDDVEQNTTASTGWETMLEGLVSSGFSVVGTWPMRTEQPKGLRESGRNALASSIVLVCRPRPKDAGVASRRDFLAALRQELPEALRNLQKGNIAPVDLAQAAIGPGMAVFSRYARVLETDGSPMGVRTALALINQALDEVLAEQEGEFDADTRWALAWFDQYGFTEGAYGVAETLSTAKNTSVSGMVEAGILAAKGGKVRLLKKDELDTDWDPAVDKRLTIWEAAHYSIRALESKGESAAAALMKKLGAKAELARDLAYRLYTALTTLIVPSTA
jgi:putative DNA methylase